MIQFDANRLRELAGILANIDHADLKACGMDKGHWDKFNERSMDMFLLKLPENHLSALWDLIESRMLPEKE